MRELVQQRATIVVGLLLTVTGVSYWLTVGHGSAILGEAQSTVWAQVVVLAFVKVRWILLDFMELRTAPVRLRALVEAGALSVFAVLCLLSVAHF